MNYETQIAKTVEAIAPELKKLALYIHANPELGLQEYKACKEQVTILEKYGFKVETGFCGFETAYKAVYKGTKAGPKIAMLAEYDALPELGHGCGHNLIAMVGVGAGIAMKELIDEFGGEVWVIGTPAEESAGAKVKMSENGAFDGIDVVMMAHPFAINGESMNTLALNAYRIKFYGKSAHAAAAPHEGINALDSMLSFFNMINALRQQTREDARIHGIITKGGTAANVIPDYTEAELCIRASKCAYLSELCEKVINCAKAAALGTGTRLEIEKYDEDFKDTNSNMVLSDLNTAQMEKLGVSVTRHNGAILPGSSDLGDVSYVCPAIQCTFDIMNGKPGGAHTIEFTEGAASEYAMENGLTYVKGFAMTALELLTNPAHLEAIKEEFAKSV